MFRTRFGGQKYVPLPRTYGVLKSLTTNYPHRPRPRLVSEGSEISISFFVGHTIDGAEAILFTVCRGGAHRAFHFPIPLLSSSSPLGWALLGGVNQGFSLFRTALRCGFCAKSHSTVWYGLGYFGNRTVHILFYGVVRCGAVRCTLYY